MVKIISDSTCDLSKELLEKYNVDIIPLHVHLGDDEFEDGVTITPDEIYKWAGETGGTPKTAAVSLGEVIEKFEEALKENDKIICFSISDSMSSTGQIMRMAVNELDANDRIFVIDSENLSTGVGHLVIEAAIMAENGMKALEIVEKINELKKNVKASFVVDTLAYLFKGGRCSGTSAFIGSAIKIHPTIVVENGSMVPKKKYRGKISSVVLNYAKDMEDDLLNAKKDRVFITHSGCDKEVVDKVYNYLKELNHFDEILITRAGSVVFSHCGPGTLGVLYICEN